MASDPLPKPGAKLAGRPLHFFILADCSGSMEDKGKIQSLNQAIREALPHMKKAAAENPNAAVYVRCIKFSTGAQWQTAPTPIADFNWTDLSAAGTTDLGKALSMVAEELKIDHMPQRGLPPVLVLVTDGEPTDDWASGLKSLMDQPWGKRAVRVAIAIGQDANLEVLQKFMGTSARERPPLVATNPEQLITFIKWASTQVVGAVTKPASQVAAAAPAGGDNVILPPPPMAVPVPANPATAAADPGDVW
jgi:uncharacterized protein YegL